MLINIIETLEGFHFEVERFIWVSKNFIIRGNKLLLNYWEILIILSGIINYSESLLKVYFGEVLLMFEYQGRV